MRSVFLAGLVCVLCCLAPPTFAVPGAMRWSEAKLMTVYNAVSPDGSLIAIQRGFGKAAVYHSDTLTQLCEITLAACG
jgi:hypothetical protein